LTHGIEAGHSARRQGIGVYFFNFDISKKKLFFVEKLNTKKTNPTNIRESKRRCPLPGVE
jgi:hypothetical protein